MLTNLLSLVVLTLAMYIIVKMELTNILNWIHKDRTDTKEYLLEVYDFWREVLKSKVRLIAVIIILICQRGVAGMVISIAIIIGITYFLAATNIIDNICWENKKTQKAVTGFAVTCAAFFLLNRLGLAGILLKMISIIAIVIAIIVGLYLLRGKFRSFNK